jgi:Ca2+-binding RTX toxin-like protein
MKKFDWQIRPGRRLSYVGRWFTALLVAVLCLAAPQIVRAEVTASVIDGVLTVSSDGDDTIKITCEYVDDGYYGYSYEVRINGYDPATGPADCAPIISIIVNGGPGNDTIDLNELDTAPLSYFTSIVLNGGDGNDTITGSSMADTINGGNGNDIINGGDGDDTLTGGPGDDTMNGGAGNDTLIWNNGDNSDIMNGDDGDDTVVVNGAPAGDIITIAPNGSRVALSRTNLIPFTLDISAETLEVNSGDGDDVVTGSAGLKGLIKLTLNGGPGNDQLTGGDGDDTLIGGDGNDTMDGGEGNDKAVVNGTEGPDTINIASHGNAHYVVKVNDFTLDIGAEALEVNGGDGDDTVIVNGASAGDIFEIAPNGTHVAISRTNLIPFTVNVSAESLVVNGGDGDDVISGSTGLKGLISLTLNGGSDNDQLAGGDGDDTLNGDDGDDTIEGGPGNDTISGGFGDDILSGGEGDDIIEGGHGDNTINGGPGNDRLIWNYEGKDIINGDDGDDRVEVTGSGMATTFEITPNGSRLVLWVNAYQLDISAETVEMKGQGGSDTFKVQPLPLTTLEIVGGNADMYGYYLTDKLQVNAQNRIVYSSEELIQVEGAKEIYYSQIEEVEILNRIYPIYLPLTTKSN